MVRSSEMEKEVYNVSEQHKVPEMDSTKEEQADQFGSANEEDEDLVPTLTSNVVSLDEGFLFLVSRSSRFN